MSKLEAVPNEVKHDYKSRSEFMLAVLRAAQSRVKAMALDIEEIGISLKLGMISPEAAVTWAHQVGADAFMSAEINGGLIALDREAA